MDKRRVDKNGVQWSRWMTPPETVKEYITGEFLTHMFAFVAGAALALAWMY